MEAIMSAITANSEISNRFSINGNNLGVNNTNDDFMKIFTEALETANDAENITNKSIEGVLNNTVDDLHTIMIDFAKAELTLGLALQIRNKVIDSYNEIMRMQI